ncbi:MAG: Gfo/Idh/MocA family oxidoreductase [Clostridia bacterium]|jgi:predicted dehydrogenase|nr:Gfo/Idh/MocA family oxidoreductase [Clostridia bacterium]MCI1999777.1 Gfo/Idh/MocA family oxidoreductase [Clostridia bacterium]MCI2014307.1 Gfo/Idh/MocA family oxidoreductase [Clostridia bacterium]
MIKSISDLNYVPEVPVKPRNIVSIGAGGIVSGSQLPAYKIAGFPVVGIYDLKFDKAQKVAKDFNIPHPVKTLDELIKVAKENNAVFDLAVPATEIPGILRQLPDNIAILIQKPMGENIEQAKEILNLCHSKNLTAGINFQLRQAPYIIAARKLINDGVIGEVVDIDWRVVTLQPWYLWDFLFGKERMEINYHSIHYIDCIRSFVGNPTAVYCKTMPHPKMQNLSQTRTSIIMDYGDTLRVNLHINHCHDYAPDYQDSFLKIEGLKGAIRIQLGLILDYPKGREDKVEYITYDTKKWQSIDVKGSWFNEAFIGTMGGLMKKLENPDYKFMNSVDEAYQTMCVVEACYKSSSEGGTKVIYD